LPGLIETIYQKMDFKIYRGLERWAGTGNDLFISRGYRIFLPVSRGFVPVAGFPGDFFRDLMKNFPGKFLNRDSAGALVCDRYNFPASSPGITRILTVSEQISRVLLITDWCASRDSAGKFRPTVIREKFRAPVPE
jgi:hypothetical protein